MSYITYKYILKLVSIEGVTYEDINLRLVILYTSNTTLLCNMCAQAQDSLLILNYVQYYIDNTNHVEKCCCLV